MDRKLPIDESVVETASHQQPRRPAWRFAPCIVVGIVLFGFGLAVMAERNWRAVDPGWVAQIHGDRYIVSSVTCEACTGGLRWGDELVSVAGDQHAGQYGPALALARVAPGASYEMAIRRGTEVHSINATLGPGETKLRGVLESYSVALLLYLAGAWIFIARRGDTLGRLAGLAFLLSALDIITPVLINYPGWSHASTVAALLTASLWRPWQLSVNYHFLSRFPEPVQEAAWGRPVLVLFYVLTVLLWIPTNLPLIGQVVGWSPGPWLTALMPLRGDATPGAALMSAFEMMTGIGLALVLMRTYLLLRTPDARRRMRWAAVGIIAVSMVFFVFAAAKGLWLLTGIGWLRKIADIANEIGLPAMALSVVTLAYAVARHRVMGIQVVVRRGVQHLLAKNVLRMIVLLPLLILVLRAVKHPDRSLRDLLFGGTWTFYLALAITGAISLRYRKRMRQWLDRKFFRADADREQLLLQLIEHIKTAESSDEISFSVACEVGVALEPDGLHILLAPETGGQFRIAFSRLPLRAARIRDYLERSAGDRLERSQRFSIFVCDPPGPDEPASEYRENFVFPMAPPDRRAVGALVLGPKGSDEPYTNREERLLQAIASEMAMMYEVLRLRVQVEEEQRIRMTVLGRLDSEEIRLLNECPSCGRCFTSREKACPRDGHPLTLTLPVERVLDGKYRLERRIGKGGMGVVYEASDLRLGRKVAVKIMLGTLFGNNAAMARFEREARMAAQLDQANIVGVHDFGRLATGGAYLVMELVNGRSWREHLDDGVPSDRAATWIEQLCAAVAAAHQHGIVHRDLKPENLMISREDGADRVVVLDFGLAKMRSEMSHLEPDLTLSGQIMGTRRYMSPEQRSGGRVDWRTDVYSVAVICVQTLTAYGPPRSGATLEWMREALRRIPHGPQLEGILDRALAEDPTGRMPIASLCEELIPLVRGTPIVPATGQASAADTITLDGGC